MQQLKRRFSQYRNPVSPIAYSQLIEQHSERALYFLHIQKTAGISLSSLLNQHFESSKILHYQFWDSWVFEFTAEDFKNYRLFHGHFNYEVVPLLPEALDIITVLRDPIERAISLFKHLQRLSKEHVEFKFFERCSLLEALEHRWHGRAFNNAQVSALGTHNVLTVDEWHRFQDKVRSIQANFGNPNFEFEPIDISVNLAKERLSQFICFGITERFSEFLQLLNYTFEWMPVAERYENVAPQNSPTPELDTYTYQKLVEVNTLDLELYNFAQNLFEQRLNAVSFDQLLKTGLIRRAEQKYSELPVVAALYLDFDGEIPGTGWHPFETANDGYRWTGPEAHSSLTLPLITDHALKIQFRVLAVITPRTLTELQLIANNTVIPLMYHSAPDGNGWLFEGIIPVEVLKRSKPLTKLVFEVPETLTPIEVGWNAIDQRKLGVAFDWLEIMPAKP